MRGSFFTLRNFTYPQLNWGFNHAYSAPKKSLKKEPLFLFQGRRAGIYLSAEHDLLAVSNYFYLYIAIHGEFADFHTRPGRQHFLKETGIYGINSTKIIHIRKCTYICQIPIGNHDSSQYGYND